MVDGAGPIGGLLSELQGPRRQVLWGRGAGGEAAEGGRREGSFERRSGRALVGWFGANLDVLAPGRAARCAGPVGTGMESGLFYRLELLVLIACSARTQLCAPEVCDPHGAGKGRHISKWRRRRTRARPCHTRGQSREGRCLHRSGRFVTKVLLVQGQSEGWGRGLEARSGRRSRGGGVAVVSGLGSAGFCVVPAPAHQHCPSPARTPSGVDAALRLPQGQPPFPPGPASRPASAGGGLPGPCRSPPSQAHLC